MMDEEVAESNRANSVFLCSLVRVAGIVKRVSAPFVSVVLLVVGEMACIFSMLSMLRSDGLIDRTWDLCIEYDRE